MIVTGALVPFTLLGPSETNGFYFGKIMPQMAEKIESGQVPLLYA